MSPRILLIGKNGQVGSELAVLLPRIGKVTALDRQQLDISKPHHIRRTIQGIRPQIIVNAAAYTSVDQAEKEEATARAINAVAPGIMAEEAKKNGACLVHYSTDYVFDGAKQTPYDETDKPNPINIYGKTKSAGEQAIRDVGVPHLIFRTSWIYATHGRNFLLTILRLATQREELRIVRDQIGAPTSSREIARATTDILTLILQQGKNADPFAQISGTYHMAASGETTWCDFAQAILDDASQAPQDASWFVSATDGHPLIARRVIPITTAEYSTPARRPAYSVLSTSLLLRTFGFKLSDWRAALQDAFLRE